MYKDSNEFSLHIEQIKIDHEFDTYLEAITWYYENESDQEMVEISKMLNQKIRDRLEWEAKNLKLLKDNEVNLLV